MKSLAKLIDHTFLKPDGSPSDIERLCREARERKFASVCVHPCEVARARRLLADSGVKVCTVVGFPLGQNSPETVFFEAACAIGEGADELDFVMNVGAFKNAETDCAMTESWRAIVDGCKAAKGSVVTKLIIECCSLTDAEKVRAAKMAKAAGFDFVKTSTGFAAGGATARDVRLLRKAVGKKMGVKAAGGIRTYADAAAMVEAGATRLGCSAGVAIVREEAERKAGLRKQRGKEKCSK